MFSLLRYVIRAYREFSKIHEKIYHRICAFMLYISRALKFSIVVKKIETCILENLAYEPGFKNSQYDIDNIFSPGDRNYMNTSFVREDVFSS